MRELVLLLHGLSRTSYSLRRMEAALRRNGYDTVMWDYPSRRHSIGELVRDFRRYLQRLDARRGKVHFVGHSLGAIIVRAALLEPVPFGLGRVVMLAPPNRGAALVDRLQRFTFLQRIYGRPSAELGPSSRFLQRLGVPKTDIGVIAGRRRFHPFNPTSWINLATQAEAETDGTVEVRNTMLQEMADFLVVDVSHSFIMDDAEVIRQTLHFLAHGRFERAPEGGG